MSNKLQVTATPMNDGFFQVQYSPRVAAIFKLYKREYKGRKCRIHKVYLGFMSLDEAQRFVDAAQCRQGYGKDFEIREPQRLSNVAYEVKISGMSEGVMFDLVKRDLDRSQPKLADGVTLEPEGIGARVYMGRDKVGCVMPSLQNPGKWKHGVIAGCYDYRMSEVLYGSMVEAANALAALIEARASRIGQHVASPVQRSEQVGGRSVVRVNGCCVGID